MAFGPPIWVHLLLWSVMVTVLIAVRTGNLREGQSRRCDDRAKLRAGLIAELRALRTAYRLNWVLGQDGTLAVSGRPYFTMYRGNMQRLLLLTEAEVSAVVRCHAACEALDAAIMLHLRLDKQRGAVASREAATNFSLRRLHRAARGNVRIAIEALSTAAAREAALEPWYRRLWRRLHGEPAPAPVEAAKPASEIVRLPPPMARAG